MPSFPALTIYAFGLSAFFTGIYTVFGPQPDDCVPESQANGLAAIAVGAFYMLAAAQENRGFFVLTVLTRALTMAVFLRNGERYGPKWKIAALWEGIGAGLTAGALQFHNRRRRG